MKPPRQHIIETRIVAPFAGAWIETVADLTPVIPIRSPPSRGRGLKPKVGSTGTSEEVAPFAGAWIETAR